MNDKPVVIGSWPACPECGCSVVHLGSVTMRQRVLSASSRCDECGTDYDIIMTGDVAETAAAIRAYDGGLDVRESSSVAI